MAKDLKYIEVERLEPQPKPIKKKKKVKPKAKKKPLSKEEKAKMDFWDNIPASELNPGGEKDFDIVLGEMLKPVSQEKEKNKRKRRAKKNPEK